MIVRSFPPIISPGARVLILGSAPGGRALTAGEYYAHPQNQFWPIMGELVGAGRALPYAARAARLTEAGIALWNVLAECERVGSLDARIVRASEVPNDVAGLLAAETTIRAVCFNGRLAEQAFGRHVRPALPPEVAARLATHVLPSTSAAYAAMAYAEKVERWRAVLRYTNHASAG
jgi:hypoxanthine-DNA glycosylase